jgi:hypothetical protein
MPTSYALNHSFDLVHVSSTTNHGYMKRLAPWKMSTANAIFYSIVTGMILSFLLAVIFIWILHFHQSHSKNIPPLIGAIGHRSARQVQPSISVTFEPDASASEQPLSPTAGKRPVASQNEHV